MGPRPFRAFKMLQLENAGVGIVGAQCLLLGPFKASQVFRLKSRQLLARGLRPYKADLILRWSDGIPGSPWKGLPWVPGPIRSP